MAKKKASLVRQDTNNNNNSTCHRFFVHHHLCTVVQKTLQYFSSLFKGFETRIRNDNMNFRGILHDGKMTLPAGAPMTAFLLCIVDDVDNALSEDAED